MPRGLLGLMPQVNAQVEAYTKPRQSGGSPALAQLLAMLQDRKMQQQALTQRQQNENTQLASHWGDQAFGAVNQDMARGKDQAFREKMFGKETEANKAAASQNFAYQTALAEAAAGNAKQLQDTRITAEKDLKGMDIEDAAANRTERAKESMRDHKDRLAQINASTTLSKDERAAHIELEKARYNNNLKVDQAAAKLHDASSEKQFRLDILKSRGLGEMSPEDAKSVLDEATDNKSTLGNLFSKLRSTIDTSKTNASAPTLDQVEKKTALAIAGDKDAKAWLVDSVPKATNRKVSQALTRGIDRITPPEKMGLDEQINTRRAIDTGEKLDKFAKGDLKTENDYVDAVKTFYEAPPGIQQHFANGFGGQGFRERVDQVRAAQQNKLLNQLTNEPDKLFPEENFQTAQDTLLKAKQLQFDPGVQARLFEAAKNRFNPFTPNKATTVDSEQYNKSWRDRLENYNKLSSVYNGTALVPDNVTYQNQDEEMKYYGTPSRMIINSLKSVPYDAAQSYYKPFDNWAGYGK